MAAMKPAISDRNSSGEEMSMSSARTPKADLVAPAEARRLRGCW
jgi:hypothetical protein